MPQVPNEARSGEPQDLPADDSGMRIRDRSAATFTARLGAAMARSAALAGVPAPPTPASGDVEALDGQIDGMLDALRGALDGLTQTPATGICRSALSLGRLRDEAVIRQMERRMAALRGVHEALAALHRVVVPAQLYDLATSELCARCGFDRAVLFSVTDGDLVPQSVHFPLDPKWAEEVLLFGRTEGRPRLSESLLEREMVRRRAPALVLDAQNDPRTHKLMAQATRTKSYVAAPIQPEGEVIGFLHADCYDSGRDVDEIDRDTLWTFAEGYGYALERSLLRVHLHEQRERLDALAGSASALAADLGVAEMALERSGRDALAATSRATARLAGPPVEACRDLTRRELQVLELLADGATNADISAQLFIAESTAKAHVKHILRKLGASNRAEAVSVFLRGAMHGRPGS